jgi:signal transduction histidine kinase
VSRRLVAALLLFTAALLVVSVVPLGLTVSSRDRSDYGDDTRSLALSLATLAAGSFDEAHRSFPTSKLVATTGPDVTVRVVGLDGRVVVASGPARQFPRSLLAAARAGRPASRSFDDAFVAAAPVLADGRTRGVVLLARSDETVERRITRLWIVLGSIAAGALLLSALLAVGFARWVQRPLGRLRSAALRWSEGSLHERAAESDGPPELREVAAALNVMAARLDTLVHSSRAVLADVSHQLRTPLAAVRLRLELVRDELAGAPAAAAIDEDLACGLRELDRLSRLVDGLLAVANAENSEQPSTAVDVMGVLSERVAAWQPVAADRGVGIDVSAPRERAVVSVTAGHLDQILDNLIDNSVEAMPDGGQLRLTVRRDREHCEIAVRDTGVGMSKEQQDNAFRRFSTGRPGSGSGLGLAIVHRLVTADGGTVALSSEVGRGTEVRVRLRVARRDEITAAAHPRSRPRPAAVTAAAAEVQQEPHPS